MRMLSRMTVAALAVALTVGTHEAAAGASLTDVVRPEPQKAQELFRQAESLLNQPKQWRRAVRLFEQSAQLREAADPGIYSCLIYAGRMRAAFGDYDGALSALERAGDSALGRGAVLDAAHAYVDAAYAAVELGRSSHAKDLADRAELLAESPLLSGEQRASITRRLRA